MENFKIPENFCILPFIHLSTKPPGYARYCCFAPNNLIYDTNNKILKLDDDINKIWNSEHAKSFRKQFLNNERPKTCDYCWKEESIGKKSKRLKELKNYKKTKIKTIIDSKNNDGETALPIYLDLRLGNKCNLKCRTCNSMFSSAIENEVNTKWNDSFFAKKEQFKAKEDINAWYKTEQFSKNLEKLIPTLEHVYITGGEPTIIPELLQFLKKCIELDRQNFIFIRFNTNLSIYNDEFYNILKQFKRVDLGPSIDAIGDKLTYMRHPLKWNKLEENFKKILLLPENISITVNCTVSIYNILYLEELYCSLKEIAQKNNRKINFIFEIAHEPKYINFNILTDEIKIKATKAIDNFIKNIKLNKSQKDDLESIKKLLIINPENIKALREKFKIFNNEIDKIRGEKFEVIFPELKEMIINK